MIVIKVPELIRYDSFMLTNLANLLAILRMGMVGDIW